LHDDIKITGMDEDKTQIQESGNSNIYLTVSTYSIPLEWRELFNKEWKDNLHSTWKPAEAMSNHILIQCHHSNLHTDQMPSLERVIRMVNEKYKDVCKQKETAATLKAKNDTEELERKNKISSDLQNGFKKP
jgi:hypothetical protein